MSYRDLPSDLATHPLEDDVIRADVIDLIAEPEAREVGCLALMLCDDRGIGVQPVVLGELIPGRVMEGTSRLLSITLPDLAASGGSLVAGLGRPGSVLLSDADRGWHQLVLDLCREHEVTLLGAYIATPSAVRPFPPDLRVAS